MKNKKVNIIFRKYKLLFFSIIAIFLIFSFFQAFSSFFAKGKEHDIAEFEFKVSNTNERNSISSIACGDINGDKKDEIITIKSSNNPKITYFDEQGKLIDSFLVNTRNKNLNFDIASGDIDGNGIDEIFIVPKNNNSFVKIFKDNKIYYEFNVFKNAKIGASITSGDINYDGREEIILGAGEGGGPQVKAYNFKGKELASFFAFNPSLRSGIDVATGNFDEDENEEIFVSQKSGGQGLAKIYKFNDSLTFFDTISFYPRNLNLGANISTGDVNDDNKAEVLATKDVDEGNSDLRILNYNKDFLKLNSELLSDLEGNVDLNVCDFKDKKAIVLNTEKDPYKIKIIYKY